MLLAELDQGKGMRLQSQRQRVVLEGFFTLRRKRGGFSECFDLRERGKRRATHFVPGWERRAMFLVHGGDPNRLGASETLEMERESFWGARFFGEEEIPGRDNARPIFAARHEHAIGAP